MMTSARILLHAALALPGLFCGLRVSPVLANEERQFTVELTVGAAPCTINNGNLVEVAFGSGLVTTKVKDGIYRRTIDYNARCTAPRLRTGIIGNAASFDSTVLATSNPNLGIQFISNQTSQPLNTWRNLSDAGGSAVMPTLEAVLVRNPKAPLVAGPFTASATLRIDYQ